MSDRLNIWSIITWDKHLDVSKISRPELETVCQELIKLLRKFGSNWLTNLQVYSILISDLREFDQQNEELKSKLRTLEIDSQLSLDIIQVFEKVLLESDKEKLSLKEQNTNLRELIKRLV